MDSAALRAVQQPLKDAYSRDPQLATLLSLTERYCVVYQTLAHPVPVRGSASRGTVRSQ